MPGILNSLYLNHRKNGNEIKTKFVNHRTSPWESQSSNRPMYVTIPMTYKIRNIKSCKNGHHQLKESAGKHG